MPGVSTRGNTIGATPSAALVIGGAGRTVSRGADGTRRLEDFETLHERYEDASRPHRISGCSRFVTNRPSCSVAQ